MRNEYYIHADRIGFVKVSHSEIKRLKGINRITFWCTESVGYSKLKFQHYYVENDSPVLKCGKQ